MEDVRRWQKVGLMVAALLVGAYLSLPKGHREPPSLPSGQAVTPDYRPMKIEAGIATFELAVRATTDEWYSDCTATVDGEWTATIQIIHSVRPIRVHLADFTRGGLRYDWQRRSPSSVEIVCREFKAAGTTDWVSPYPPFRWFGRPDRQ